SAADHLRLVPDFVDGADHAHRIWRIGEDGNEVWIGSLDRPHDWREVGSRGWIPIVVHNLQAGGSAILTRALGAIYREFRISRHDCHPARLWVLRHCNLEEALGHRRFRSWSQRNHGEISWVVKLGIDCHPEQTDEQFPLLNYRGHCWRQ